MHPCDLKCAAFAEYTGAKSHPVSIGHAQPGWLD
jgi:hypothetical protein